MRPKHKISQAFLFTSKLQQILNDQHPLYKLASSIDWQTIDKQLACCYSEDMGRPANATRLMVGLHYLKHTYNESDESVIERWVENPYWQYFCGYEYMQHQFPIHPTSMVKWRHRVGAERMEIMLKETLSTAIREKQIKQTDASKIIVDTTVQEKAIAHPTDARLYLKSICRLIKLARQRNIDLRQSYIRVSKRAFFSQGQYARAGQYKRAAKQTKKLKTYLGRLIRDIIRKAANPDRELALMLERTSKIHSQKRDDRGKLYSLDAPEVECISKGKAHRRYEFGCKVSFSITHKNNWITSAAALHGNPYDGHTLSATVARSESNTQVKAAEVYVDRGYRGHDYAGLANVFKQDGKLKQLTQAIKKKLKRRSAIEPTIGHVKSDNRMDRNYLKGTAGDMINAILAAAGYNMRKLLTAFLSALLKIYEIFVRLAVHKAKVSVT
ncbi:MAG: IS5 family transposase [Planctomycetaceae bacterium]|nr:IS5 family transposase [Planctomycetaceae bacterium]